MEKNEEKTNVTVRDVVLVRLEMTEVLDMAYSRNCNVTWQTSYVKITHANSTGRALYVSNTKRGVSRIDIAGWDPPPIEIIERLSPEEAKEMKLGAVRGQIFTKKLRCGHDVVASAVGALLDDLADGGIGFKVERRMSDGTTT